MFKEFYTAKVNGTWSLLRIYWWLKWSEDFMPEWSSKFH